MYVSSECTGCKGNDTGPEFQNLRGDSDLDSGEYILFRYKEVSGLAREIGRASCRERVCT